MGNIPNDSCAIARSLGVLGERWTFLILREAVAGSSRFSEFRSGLGVAPDVLTERLNTLVAYGVMEKAPYREPGERARFSYVLTDAGLIVREKTGRTVSCRLTAQPMEQAMNWLNRYAQFWSEKFDRLAAFVEDKTWPTQPSAPIPAQPSVQTNVQASRSRAGSAHGRRKSTPPGPKPRS